MIRVHGTCVAIGERGILLRGGSGAGKSDLALRLIDRGGRLVADDQVELTPRAGVLHATAPESIRGLLEVRGLGLVEVPYADACALVLVVDLVDGDEIERLPAENRAEIAGVAVPAIRVDPRQASAEVKVRLAAGTVEGVIMRPS
jgi:serine kinase of HPr protein (carbohydrate metabolism regulator)